MFTPISNYYYNLMSVRCVRKYRESDRDAVRDICYRTGLMGESAESYWPHKESFVELWTSYYTDEEPESLYVATINDVVVGYLTGCMDTASAPRPAERFAAILERYELWNQPGVAEYLIRAKQDSANDTEHPKGELLDPRWPAHLHINLLPEARGTGLGALLMKQWQDHLRQAGVPGCHLGTIAENTRAIGFFERMGFEKYGRPVLIPGLRGPVGERLHEQLMVWST